MPVTANYRQTPVVKLAGWSGIAAATMIGLSQTVSSRKQVESEQFCSRMVNDGSFGGLMLFDVSQIKALYTAARFRQCFEA